MFLMLTMSIRPMCECERPMPLCLTPPQGSSGAACEKMQSLTYTVPTCNLGAIACASRTDADQIEAVSPKSLSLARRTASSTERTTMIAITGPKVSSRMTAISWLTPVRTVGA